MPRRILPVDVDDGDADVLADVNLLTELPAEDQHVSLPSYPRSRGCLAAQFYATFTPHGVKGVPFSRGGVPVPLRYIPHQAPYPQYRRPYSAP